MPPTARKHRGNWRLLCVACALLALFRLALPLLGYRRIDRLFPNRSQSPPDAYAARVALVVHRASRLVPGANCLVQACAGRALFALRNYRVVMRVGVRAADADGIDAHAWLLSGERVILGGSTDEVQMYRTIADFG